MANQQGTQFPITTAAQVFPVFATGMGELPRERDKRSVKGEPTFSTGTILRVQSKDGTVRADKTASVNVIQADQNGYGLGVVYRAEGRVYVQPYENNGRLAYSILTERLVPVTEKQG